MAKLYPKQLFVVGRVESNEDSEFFDARRSTKDFLGEYDTDVASLLIGVYELKEVREVRAELVESVLPSGRGKSKKR